MGTTVEELNTQCKVIAELREEEVMAKGVLKEIQDKLSSAESRMVEMLTENDLTSFKSPFGQTIISYFTSVKTPKTPADRAAFFDYLKSKGLFESLITVNSNTLNAFYKAELEVAKERGDTDVQIPGLTEITISPRLSFRR